MSLPYSVIAECYDSLNSHVDYKGWAEGLSRILRSYGVKEGDLVLDLACGTGSVTLPLAELGYDMIGVDMSYEMLGVAMEKKAASPILWLCQDMRAFELYGTVAATVCCLDSINYLTGKVGLGKCFSLVHNYLDPDGIFIFDVNTPHKFDTVYSDRHYVLEGDGVTCAWKNYYDKKSGLCDFELSFFYEQEDGSYIRRDETQRERCWSIKTLSSLLVKNGFEVLSISSDLNGSPLTDDSERAFFICRAKK
jgi:SAM-dependent methyltransferase